MAARFVAAATSRFEVRFRPDLFSSKQEKTAEFHFPFMRSVIQTNWPFRSRRKSHRLDRYSLPTGICSASSSQCKNETIAYSRDDLGINKISRLRGNCGYHFIVSQRAKGNGIVSIINPLKQLILTKRRRPVS